MKLKIIITALLAFTVAALVTGYFMFNDKNEELKLERKIEKLGNKVSYQEKWYGEIPCEIAYAEDTTVILDTSGEPVCKSLISSNVLLYARVKILFGRYTAFLIAIILGTLTFLYYSNYRNLRDYFIPSLLLVILASFLEFIVTTEKSIVAGFLFNLCIQWFGSLIISKIVVSIVILIVIDYMCKLYFNYSVITNTVNYLHNWIRQASSGYFGSSGSRSYKSNTGNSSLGSRSSQSSFSSMDSFGSRSSQSSFDNPVNIGSRSSQSNFNPMDAIGNKGLDDVDTNINAIANHLKKKNVR